VSGRILAIGDIHGCHVALDTLLSLVQPTGDDRLIVLGDVVDRGPGTRQAVDQLLHVRQFTELIFIMGNHEEMMLGAVEDSRLASHWLTYGGSQTLDSYGGGFGQIPSRHWDFLHEGIDLWEGTSEIFVHAAVQRDVALAEQSSEWLRWNRFTGEEPPHASGRRIVCGHTVQTQGVPYVANGWVCIDTWAYGGQFLTCLDVTHDLVYQANQRGDARGPARLADIALTL
jgi:serine/threonine protein phosphatase 1